MPAHEAGQAAWHHVPVAGARALHRSALAGNHVPHPQRHRDGDGQLLPAEAGAASAAIGCGGAAVWCGQATGAVATDAANKTNAVLLDSAECGSDGAT
jgi:hypothetical protein